MFDRIGTKNLIVLFVVLFLIAAYLLFFNSGEERSFRKDLVSIDTSKVSEIYIYPSDKKDNIHLLKTSGKWELILAENKKAPVVKNRVTNLLNELVKIQATGLTTRDDKKWKEYNVDSTGTRIKVLQNGTVTLDLIVGRISFQQPNSITTYVRLNNDANVYSTDGYLGMSVNFSKSSFRNSTIISSSKSNWKMISFKYPSDSSFVLTRNGNRWAIENKVVDSLKAEELLNNLENLTSPTFADYVKPGDLINPAYKVVIDLNDNSQIKVDAFLDSSKIIIHSSQNPDSYFEGNKELDSKLFLSPKRFVKK